MELFDLGRLLHSAVGTIALGSFWTAALASKGGRTHRKAGKVYLLALIGVMTLSTLMVAGKALEGDPGTAIFLGFLISMVGTASWLMWFSIRYRRDAARLLGPVYRALASWLMLSGLALFGLGAARGAALMMFLSLLGVGFGANMWRLALAPERDWPVVAGAPHQRGDVEFHRDARLVPRARHRQRRAGAPRLGAAHAGRRWRDRDRDRSAGQAGSSAEGYAAGRTCLGTPRTGSNGRKVGSTTCSRSSSISRSVASPIASTAGVAIQALGTDGPLSPPAPPEGDSND